MKRFVCLTFVMVLMIALFPVKVSAAEKEIISLDDGYIVVDVFSLGMRASGSVTGGKQYTYYDNSNTAQWKAVLTGTFSYTGSSSSCTASSVDVTIYNSAWYVFTKSASKSGNTAKASVTMKRTYDGIPVSVPVSLTLSCDANGNLS